MKKLFENKVAVVTGAGGTLCSEIAVRLAEEGAKVVLVGRTAEKLQKVADKIVANGDTCLVYPCDVTDKEAVDALAAKVEETFGPCDFLINGAGGNNIKAMPTITKFDERELTGELPEGERGLYNIDLDAFHGVLDLNTMGTVLPTLAFARQMAKNGGGNVINFASMNTYCPLTRCFAYAMSKAAVSNLTQSFAAYFAPAKIRINAIAPGFMVNERSKNYLGTVEEGLTKRGEQVIGHTPMGRFGEASDLIGCVKWLLNNDAAGFVTGITVPVDGGFLTLGGV
ncbi:MAG: SDR family NAD(P)-dependent oxidoreductase [Clostridia bacterium]|nr:SDR family NAD(P)-dependent oxidoreductase [Clostridia bacterium]